MLLTDNEKIETTLRVEKLVRNDLQVSESVRPAGPPDDRSFPSPITSFQIDVIL
jgi:hypothetical protein